MSNTVQVIQELPKTIMPYITHVDYYHHIYLSDKCCICKRRPVINLTVLCYGFSSIC